MRKEHIATDICLSFVGTAWDYDLLCEMIHIEGKKIFIRPKKKYRGNPSTSIFRIVIEPNVYSITVGVQKYLTTNPLYYKFDFLFISTLL